MGLYSRDTTEQLNTQRAELRDSLHKRLTQPTEIDHGGSGAKYAQRTTDIKREIAAIDAELDRREGVPRATAHLLHRLGHAKTGHPL